MTKRNALTADMDGVLIEAKDWHYEALNKALGLFGMEISRYDHLITYDGLPTRKKLEMLSMERGLPHELHAFINSMKQIFASDLVHTKCKPVFYHQYALSRLMKEGYRLAMCSNSIRTSVEIMMQKSKLAEHFELTLSNEDVSKPKPDPEIYINAMQKLGLDPKECLILEDNENGIKSALASGAHLMKIYHVHDVNYHNIKDRIAEIESEGK